MQVNPPGKQVWKDESWEDGHCSRELDYLAKIGWEAIDEADRVSAAGYRFVLSHSYSSGKFMLRMMVANGSFTQ